MNNFEQHNQKSERGFSYLDVMIAIVIMFTGILALTSALMANLVRSYETEKRIIAKQLALSTIESVISARNIKRPGTIEGWQSIGNINAPTVPLGIFVNGLTPIREDLGWDGIAGTIDDACPEDSPCNVTDRPINNSPIMTGYARRIVISDIQDAERPSPPNPITRRRIEVTIQYDINGISRDVVMSTLLTDY